MMELMLACSIILAFVQQLSVNLFSQATEETAENIDGATIII